MKRLDLTLPTLPENLALDEAMLRENSRWGDLLRFWQPPAAAVVLGRASRVMEEVQLAACDEERIPLLRRCSGGATVLISPGCLMYSVIMSVQQRPALRVVDQVHRFVLDRVRSAVAQLGLDVEMAGTSDLIWQGRKFAGNSLRCLREAFLYHGTLMIDADVRQIERCLTMPPRQPEYRAQRSHADFLTNLPVDRAEVCHALADQFRVTGQATGWPQSLTQQLVRERYAADSWNRQR